MKSNRLLGIPLSLDSRKTILEKIIKYLSSPTGMFHIVSLNPEILVTAESDKLFKKVIETAQMRINDGVGVVLAGQMLGMHVGERVAGVDLMQTVIEYIGKDRSSGLFIGGRPNIALRLTQCYQQKYQEARFTGLEGIHNIQKPSQTEEKAIISIVRATKPSVVFVSFGSPYQEKWIDSHKELFQDMIVMGVGGAFDFLDKLTPRAPQAIQKLGLEWLYRLVRQPWRWRRQLRLIKFIYLVLRQKVVGSE